MPAMTIALTLAGLAFLCIVAGFTMSYAAPKAEAAINASLIGSTVLTAASLLAFLAGAFTL